MTTEIIQNNKIIADYMGERRRNLDLDDTQSGYHYHDSWDALMPVVETLEEDTGYELVIRTDSAYWNSYGEQPEGCEDDYTGSTRRECVWNAVVGLIQTLKTSVHNENEQ